MHSARADVDGDQVVRYLWQNGIFEKRPIQHGNERMQTIYLITTGGTIEKVYSEQDGSALNSVSTIERYLKQLRLPDRDVPAIPLNSLEMTAQDRRCLAA